ncbi:MAG: hypothetical protein KGI78_00475 [Patescibacteria group bacterium]|nr:hypothetical protein [Patescibacteria group bacterium]MDE1944514.1 hypothetical protein [Patescibacteria group bacterium]MDE1944867.1 hypothetical protein [Patescibacteria group bacterium]MDE2057313.1 hypothetical protein [Patescibacteria group bacterium]
MENETGFNELEKAILKWCSEKYEDSALTSQLVSASFKKREWTKVGFYTYFDVPRTLQPVASISMARRGFPITGPFIESPDIEFGGGSLLWGKDGYIDCLELYANGGSFKEHVGQFHLR